MATLAIDPGLFVGIAHRREGQPVQAVPMSATEGGLVNLLRDLTANSTAVVAVVEEIGGYVGVAQPASSAFKFGRNFGFILGIFHLAVQMKCALRF